MSPLRVHFPLSFFQQIEMSKSRGIARFGLMHLVATNLCEWLNVIVEETKHEIIHLGHMSETKNGHEAEVTGNPLEEREVWSFRNTDRV